MKLFVSYARRDLALVEALHAHLERFGHQVWRDEKLVGGKEWWDEICAQLRGCDAVVFALSPSSVRSRYCMAELQYAKELVRPLLPVMIVDTPLATAPRTVQTTNVVTYIAPDVNAVVALSAALSQLPSNGLPQPMPAQPVAPLGELPGLRDRIMKAEPLDEHEQQDLVVALRRVCDGGEDVAFEVVRLLRRRHDLYESVARDLDELLAQAPELVAVGPEGRALVKSLLSQAAQCHLTPILGSGLTDALVGSRRKMALSFAEEFDFPLAEHLRDDLPQVAQYVLSTAGRLTMRERLRSHLDKQLRATLGSLALPQSDDLDALFAAAWDARDRGVPDPHEMLAGLNCAIYVTAHPSLLLEHALRAAGKAPVTEVCRWKLDDSQDEWPASALGDDPDFEPSADQPLVFHVFGLLAWPDTLVVTEDDYFRFLIGVTSQRDTKVPEMVRSALADSALLVLGFGLDDWDFRTLWQALMSQEGNNRLRRYKHTAAQVDPAGSVVSPAAARRYLGDHFGRESNPSLDLFWGSVTQFTTAVNAERAHAG